MSDLLELPKPKLKARNVDLAVQSACLSQGLHPLLARIIASRPAPQGVSAANMLLPKLAALDAPHSMQDIKKAAKRVANAIINKEYIGIETDHDCDGQTSHAVIYANLTAHFKHPANKIYSYIGHRLNEGYGLSDPVVDRILQAKPRASVVITADNGSADEPRIARLQAVGIDVIVTDHHGIPSEGIPKSAYACLNPVRDDCGYPDKYIAGCMVAWLLMVVVREELISCGHLSTNAPKLLDTLDFVAVGTVADCVSMAKSKNNRAVVTYGLQHIQAGVRPCWRAIKTSLSAKLTAEDLAFRIAPLLNSDGRLASAFGSVSFLLAENDLVAKEWVVQLQELNKQRKKIQKDITTQGIIQALGQANAGRKSLVIFLEDGHAGVHGISASNIKEYFGRPTAFFAPKVNNNEILAGSLRGVENFHVREALQFVASVDPTMFISFGGHKGAAGVTLKREKFPSFMQLFEQATELQLAGTELYPVILTDGELPADWISLEILAELSKLEPYGREFEVPVFEAQAKLRQLRVIGDGNHARVILDMQGRQYNAVWFGMRQAVTEPILLQVGDLVKVAYALKLNDFNGSKKCELQIIALEKVTI